MWLGSSGGFAQVVSPDVGGDAVGVEDAFDGHGLGGFGLDDAVAVVAKGEVVGDADGCFDGGAGGGDVDGAELAVAVPEASGVVGEVHRGIGVCHRLGGVILHLWLSLRCLFDYGCKYLK